MDEDLYTEHANEIEGIYRDAYKAIFGQAYEEAGRLLPTKVRYDVHNPRIKDVLDGLATKVRGVADTTREDIRRLVDQATEGGWSPAKLAKEIMAQGEEMSLSRARMISRTESGTAYNRGSILAYGDAGITEVDVMDGDKDTICAAANGSVWTLDEADSNPLGHPNCTRAFGPRVGLPKEASDEADIEG